MYAIIETGGKQYKVAEGDVLFIEKLEVAEGDAVAFDQVLAVSKDGSLVVGEPLVVGAKVTAKVEKHGKDRKFISTKRRKTTAASKVIVNRTRRLSSRKSRLNRL
jgi:large subunit ribosomal protein L21